MTSVEVVNVDTLERRWYTLPACDAIVAAYARSLGDLNTWGYGKYADRVVRIENNLGVRYIAGSWWCRE